MSTGSTSFRPGKCRGSDLAFARAQQLCTKGTFRRTSLLRSVQTNLDIHRTRTISPHMYPKHIVYNYDFPRDTRGKKRDLAAAAGSEDSESQMAKVVERRRGSFFCMPSARARKFLRPMRTVGLIARQEYQPHYDKKLQGLKPTVDSGYIMVTGGKIWLLSFSLSACPQELSRLQTPGQPQKRDSSYLSH